jgi:hypothetical protein
VGPLGLCIHCASLPIGHSLTSSFDGYDSATRVFFDQYYNNYYSIYDLIPNLIELLWWTWLSVYSVDGHIRVWILLCFIILFYLAGLFEISVCPKGLSPLTPDWYRKSRELSFDPWLVHRGSHLLLYSFCHSRVVISFW